MSDYAKFLEQFKSEEAEAGVTKIQIWGTPSVVRNVGGYAAITALPFREALEKNVKLADEVPAALAPWRTWLAKKDAAVVVLAPGIRLLSAKVQQGIAAIKPFMAQAGGQAKQAAAALDMYVTFFQAAEKEVASFGLGVERRCARRGPPLEAGPPGARRRLGRVRRRQRNRRSKTSWRGCRRDPSSSPAADRSPRRRCGR